MHREMSASEDDNLHRSDAAVDGPSVEETSPEEAAKKRLAQETANFNYSLFGGYME